MRFRDLLKKLRANWGRLREELQNQKQNRQFIGEDKIGNKYYQYYSHYGLPIRRQVRFKTMENIYLTDLVYYRWLYNIEFDPPTQTEKQQFYLEERQRKERAIAWDQKQQQMMIQFRKKKQELQLRNQALMELQKQLQQSSELTEIKTKRKS